MATARVITVEKKVVPGASYRIDTLVAMPNPYPQAAGVVFTPSDLGVNRIHAVQSIMAANLAGGVNTPVVVPTFATDGTNDITSFSIHFIVGSTGVEVADNADLSGCSYLISVYAN